MDKATDTITRIYFHGRRMEVGTPGSTGYAYRVRFLGHIIKGARAAREVTA
jgi:hypothetical protein